MEATYPLCESLGIAIFRTEAGDECGVADVLARFERHGVRPENSRLTWDTPMFAPEVETELQRIKGEWTA